MYCEMISQHQQRETFQALGKQNITMHSAPLRQNIGTNVEMQSRSANSSDNEDTLREDRLRTEMETPEERDARLIN